MEDAYEKLKRNGYNTVDNLVKWLKDSKIIESKQEAEVNARKLFQEAQSQADVQLDTFKHAVDQIARDQKKASEELHRTLAEEGPRLMEALKAAAKAFQETLQKK